MLRNGLAGYYGGGKRLERGDLKQIDSLNWVRDKQISYSSLVGREGRNNSCKNCFDLSIYECGRGQWFMICDSELDDNIGQILDVGKHHE